jgi:hypothetical protein
MVSFFHLGRRQATIAAIASFAMLFAAIAPFIARTWVAAHAGAPLLADLCLGARFEAAGAASSVVSEPQRASPIAAARSESLPPKSTAFERSVGGDAHLESGAAERSCCALCLPHGGSLALEMGSVPSLGLIPAAPLRLSAIARRVAATGDRRLGQPRAPPLA